MLLLYSSRGSTIHVEVLSTTIFDNYLNFIDFKFDNIFFNSVSVLALKTWSLTLHEERFSILCTAQKWPLCRHTFCAVDLK